jgi:hypothetical protein
MIRVAHPYDHPSVRAGSDAAARLDPADDAILAKLEPLRGVA